MRMQKGSGEIFLPAGDLSLIYPSTLSMHPLCRMNHPDAWREWVKSLLSSLISPFSRSLIILTTRVLPLSENLSQENMQSIVVVSQAPDMLICCVSR